MYEKIISPVKINLTLRVLSNRVDGYHDIYSLFLKKKAAEELTITPYNDENIKDTVNVSGIQIEGENILSKTLEWARGRGLEAPPLNVSVEKRIPPGSGVGAGSGNAAALLGFLKKEFGFAPPIEEISQLGADVAFLASDFDAASAEGKGEILKSLGPAPELIWVVAFPAWVSNTELAYKTLDDFRQLKGDENRGEINFEEEAKEIFDRLARKERIGLLPNDFLSLFEESFVEYRVLFDIADLCGALAYGLCGSGSAVFALFSDALLAAGAQSAYKKLAWIKKTLVME